MKDPEKSIQTEKDSRMETKVSVRLFLILAEEWNLFQMPDITVVLFDGTVGREETGFGDVYQHFLCPVRSS